MYGGDAQIGGVVASVGPRLIEGASKQMINQSLKALVEQIKIRQGEAPGNDNGVAPSPPAEAQPAAAVAQAEASAASAVVAAPAPAPTPAPEQAAAAPASFERRTVVVPEHEQLTPESMVRGVVMDMLGERPWLPWVAIAFLLGFLLGRSRR
jgi:uncharacterized protein